MRPRGWLATWRHRFRRRRADADLEHRDVERPASRRRARRFLLLLGAGVVGAVAAIATLGFGPPTRGSVGPGTVELRARWTLGGDTEILVPPLGTVTAQTHDGPLDIEADIREIDLAALEELVAEGSPTEVLYQDAEGDVRRLLRSFATRSLLLAAAAGAVAGALVSRHRLTHVLAATLGATTAVAAALGVTWFRFDADAFAEPHYEGAIEQAPQMVDAARRHIEGFGDIRARIDALAVQISDLYAAAAAGPGPSSRDEVRILHVSDIHLNPVGLEVARQLATSFDVHAVLDTGDLTSFGSPFEAQIGDAVAQIPVPYLFVPGNHDSDENRASLSAVPNVRLLDEEIANVGGVRILGVADPTFTASNETSSEDAADIRLGDAGRVASMVRDKRPHVLAVHDARLAQRSVGQVPLVVAGHRHRRSVEFERGTLSLVVGSTGATGLGSFTVDGDQLYEAEVLRFVDGCLRAVDSVSLDGIGGSFELERRTFDFERNRDSGLVCVEVDEDQSPDGSPSTTAPSPPSAPSATDPRAGDPPSGPRTSTTRN